MKALTNRRHFREGFALVVTLVLLTLIAIVVVGYLSSTRTERATASVYANRLRAKTTADSGLAAAIHLLHDNTRYGNYITAMPAPLPSPTSIYTEVYRPADPADTTHAARPNDFLRLNNAAGEILVSRATTAAGSDQVDPRPSPDAVPSPIAGRFALPSPTPALTEERLPPQVNPATGNSYNFNQVVRVGSNNNGRLVTPLPTASPLPALGQWVRVRDSTGALVGRYAFFVEDESMKVNLNQAGNASPTPRPNDLGPTPPPIPIPTPQLQDQVRELDPAAVLPSPSANRTTAGAALVARTPGSRIFSEASVAAMGNSDWQDNLSNYGPMTTVSSRDDLTTAEGWKRLNLNALVLGAADNAAKIGIAQRFSNWIRDAWTGPVPIGNLQGFQMFGDERLRLQLAANIIDYIDADGIPTDLGNYPNVGQIPDPTTDPALNTGYPIIGIERIPYLVEVDVVYTASKTTPPVDGQAVIGMSFRFNFFNMFDHDLTLSNSVRTIRIKGVPVITKNGATVFDHEGDTYTITVGGSGGGAGTGSIPDGIVPWGPDYVANGTAGAKTFRTGQILSQQVTYSTDTSQTLMQSGLLYVDIFDAQSHRLDSTRIALNDNQAQYANPKATPVPTPNDFLQAYNSAASINGTYSSVTNSSGAIESIDYGDPRYRPSVETQRLLNLSRTDTTRYTPGTTLAGDNIAELDCRAYSVDWYDYIGDRPLLFHRDGPMLSIGELGNVSVCEFPWRTLYLQYAGRPNNTTDVVVGPLVQDRRGSSTAASSNPDVLPQDYVLMDLFKTVAPDTRDGGINLNSQYYVTNNSAVVQGAPLSLFLGEPVGAPIPTPASGPTPPPTTYLSATTASLIGAVVAGRRDAIVPITSSPWVGPAPTPPYDNRYLAPYFTIGQAASDISRAVNQSTPAPTTNAGSPSRGHTTVTYSALRITPNQITSYNRDLATDMQVEEPFRKISEAITTRGNIFRVLYVGQVIKDINHNGIVDGANEVQAEYLGEAYVERRSSFNPPPGATNPDAVTTTDSAYIVLSNRVITE